MSSPGRVRLLLPAVPDPLPRVQATRPRGGWCLPPATGSSSGSPSGSARRHVHQVVKRNGTRGQRPGRVATPVPARSTKLGNVGVWPVLGRVTALTAKVKAVVQKRKARWRRLSFLPEVAPSTLCSDVTQHNTTPTSPPIRTHFSTSRRDF